MKKTTIGLLSALSLLCSACGDGDHTVPEFKGETPGQQPVEPISPDGLYSWEQSRTEIPAYTDMVLIYGGGRQRYIPNWDEDRFTSYVRYFDDGGISTWFFDAFLFLEFADYGAGSNMVTYATGYRDPSTQKILDSAKKSDWERLINYYFTPGHNLSALDATIEKAVKILGEPTGKRQVVMSIPEPILRVNTSVNGSATKYWGEIDGTQLDFALNKDRVAACRWFIDRVREEFNKASYKHIELAGFYWLAEHSSDSQAILTPVADYLHAMKYSFNWIPYFSAQGYESWKSYGFDYAFLQPNYFFNDATPLSRLDQACTMGRKANMAMEMEFDDNALASQGRGYKLTNYMNAFRTYKVWDEQPIAYYQGNNTVHSLRVSANAADRNLYHEFGRFVTTRPIRK